ncbi:hypothetical protein N431DRAFT_425130 [Stipitochalara longipes BDJ]|nr:hypothetical protein N431DRAFT_425130 [Stipitochalara longipes BDJ]
MMGPAWWGGAESITLACGFVCRGQRDLFVGVIRRWDPGRWREGEVPLEREKGGE